MRIAGILQPGTTLGYVVESKYVRAGLIVVQTIEERDALVNSNSEALVHGTPIYVAGTHRTYRYNASTKTFTVEPTIIEKPDGSLAIEGEDGSIQGLKLSITMDDLDPTLREQLESFTTETEVEGLIGDKLKDYVTLSSLTELIADINNELSLKQDKLIAGTGISIEGNVISALYHDTKQVIFTTRAGFPSTGEEDRLYVAKDEGKIYIWNAVSTDYMSISGTSELPEIEIIDGGKAI